MINGNSLGKKDIHPKVLQLDWKGASAQNNRYFNEPWLLKPRMSSMWNDGLSLGWLDGWSLDGIGDTVVLVGMMMVYDSRR